MDIVAEYFSSISWHTIITTGLRIVMILLVAWVVLYIFKKVLQRLERQLLEKSQAQGELPTESQKRIETIVRLVRQAFNLALWVTVILVILKEMGVEVAPLIASAGIVGVAVGFGAQNLVKDFIAGFFVILENQIRVGDVAIINGTGGLVEKINFRTTVLRDLGGVVHVIPNGSIATLSNLTNEWSAYVFEIGVAYKEETDKVINVMREVGSEMKQDSQLGFLMLEEPEIFGVDKFADSAVVIKGRIKTRPIKQWEVGREYLRRIKIAFDAAQIEIPFPHRTLYIGDESKPLDIAVLENLKLKQSANDA